MRILEVIPSLGSGGGERFVVDLCNELFIQGHEVKIIVLNSLQNHDSNFFVNDISANIDVISMNKKPGADIYTLIKVRNVIDEFRPDVIHTHLNAIVYILMGNRSAKYFHTIHSDAQYEAEDRLSSIIRKILFKTKRVTPVTISDTSKKSFVDYYGVDAPLILNGRKVPSDLNTSSVQNELSIIGIDVNAPIICNVAHISRNKRQGVIARAAKRLEQDGYKFSLLMIGRRAYPEVVNEVIEADCKSVYILGEKTNPLEWLTVADGMCLMSEVEGMPISLIEAFGCGTIPICTPVGGIINMVSDGITGFLADDISEDACYRALKRYLDAPKEQIELMKERVKHEYYKYSIQTCAANYVSLFMQ